MLAFGEFERLLRQAQEGDEQAMNRLLAVMRPQLEALARGYADPARMPESTQDVVQEAWLRTWQKLGQFEGGADDKETWAMFRTWVAQLVHHVGLNARRRWEAQRRRPREGRVVSLKGPRDDNADRDRGVDPPGAGPTPSAGAVLDEEAQLVQSALGRIPDATDRAIVLLRFFEGLSLREISKRLSLGYDAVRGRFEASMSLLEKELEGLNTSG